MSLARPTLAAVPSRLLSLAALMAAHGRFARLLIAFCPEPVAPRPWPSCVEAAGAAADHCCYCYFAGRLHRLHSSSLLVSCHCTVRNVVAGAMHHSCGTSSLSRQSTLEVDRSRSHWVEG
uniref:Putative secreted peptide n=1 Tax=Anopheles braziliensis TaxID=58242 RepID=A0A2M3ZS94_9DIPT